MTHSLGQLASLSWLLMKAIWLADAWTFKWPVLQWRHGADVPAECLFLAHQWQQAHINYCFNTLSDHECLQNAATALCWIAIIGHCLYGFLGLSLTECVL